MSYLKSILTYHISSEAEVDKSMLEAHGITVHLMNANVSRAEFAAPFRIQLQVPDEQVAEAIAILRELSPQRFGSPAAVKEIEAGILRAFIRFTLVALVCTAVLFFFFIHEPTLGQRLVLSLINGVLIGGVISILYAFFKPKPKSQ
jgi:hypothetical protein